MPKFEVTSDRVAGRQRGEVVELDPERVNVAALVESGHVRQVTGQPRRRGGGEDG